ACSLLLPLNDSSKRDASSVVIVDIWFFTSIFKRFNCSMTSLLVLSFCFAYSYTLILLIRPPPSLFIKVEIESFLQILDLQLRLQHVLLYRSHFLKCSDRLLLYKVLCNNYIYL